MIKGVNSLNLLVNFRNNQLYISSNRLISFFFFLNFFLRLLNNRFFIYFQINNIINKRIKLHQINLSLQLKLIKLIFGMFKLLLNFMQILLPFFSNFFNFSSNFRELIQNRNKILSIKFQ